MVSRNALWTVMAVLVAVIAIYAMTGRDTPRPGQAPPHALDQSQKP